ncbi:MAG: 50S ribosomal protein L21 [candidate division Zixibacteria bacterium]|nr:50S ribosomal protein L21 [Candidatus Tariuqbacter arcticus]
MYGYAEIKGHQFRLIPGEEIEVPAFEVEVGGEIDISPLLVFADGEQTFFGGDCAGFTAKATVIAHGKYPKIIIFKKKRRKGYKVTRGHRQKFTTLRIDEIVKIEEAE